MKIKDLFFQSAEEKQISRIVKAVYESPEKDEILRYLHEKLDLKENFSEDILFNSKQWYIESERPESVEMEYKRKPQRHYRHKKYKTLLINESYEYYPRSKEAVMGIFKARFKKGLIFDSVCYIHHTEI